MRATSRVALFLVRSYRGHAVAYAAFGPKPKVNGWRTCETRRLPKFPALWEEEAIESAPAPQSRAGDPCDRRPCRGTAGGAGGCNSGHGRRYGGHVDVCRSMAADMPCCPDKNSMDCQDCPLVAMCVLQNAQAGVPSMAALPLRYAIRTAHVVRNDTLAAGLDRPPPDQPPRSQV